MTCGCETLIVKRSSLSERDSRDWQEKRDCRDGRWYEVRSSRLWELRTRNVELPVAHDLLVSLTIHEQRGQRQAGC